MEIIGLLLFNLEKAADMDLMDVAREEICLTGCAANDFQVLR